MASIAIAENVPAATDTTEKSYAYGLFLGKAAAEDKKYWSALADGVAMGALLGAIGTGVLIWWTEGDRAKRKTILKHGAHNQGGLHLEGFKQGYYDRTKKLKRNNRFYGGIIGTSAAIWFITQRL